jgi:DNA mismatch endonuclease, patch repair protein
LQLADVPGRPDIGFRKRKKAIMVHGCFWHAHEGCAQSRTPKTRSDFWIAKFNRNRERDQRLLEEAKAAGWDVLVLWECEIMKGPTLVERLRTFLGPVRLSPP